MSVIVLESKREEAACDVLGAMMQEALDTRDRNLIRRLRRLWDNDPWSTIKERWMSEGSTWYVYCMDGVRALVRRNQRGRKNEDTSAQTIVSDD